jgi:hypothetical protein
MPDVHVLSAVSSRRATVRWNITDEAGSRAESVDTGARLQLPRDNQSGGLERSDRKEDRPRVPQRGTKGKALGKLDSRPYRLPEAGAQLPAERQYQRSDNRRRLTRRSREFASLLIAQCQKPPAVWSEATLALEDQGRGRSRAAPAVTGAR